MLDAAQLKATRPQDSVWLSANAGSGKTRVLVDRVLRLLLNGVRPGSILCLTYTDAAATEMQQRVQESLSAWLSIDDDKLRQQITALGEPATPAQCKRARELFLHLAEDPQGLNINTVHGFCQSLIGRFPLEVGLSPNCTLLNDEQSILLKNAIYAQVMTQGAGALHAEIDQAFRDFPELMDSKKFISLVENDVESIDEYIDIEALLKNLSTHFQLREGWDEAVLREEFAEGISWSHLQRVVDVVVAMQPEKPTDQKFIVKGQNLLALRAKDVDAAIDGLLTLFLTQGGTLRQSIVTAAMMKDDTVAQWVLDTQQAVADYLKTLSAMRAMRATRAFLLLANAFILQYQSYKSEHALLDFSDQIRSIRQLIGIPGGIDWIRYKLDCAIDHLFLDEAQDTSHAQWSIMKGLHADFFDGGQERHRTLFVVGDPKQSIYRFQGAEPEGFFRERDVLSAKGVLKVQELLSSYRSAQPILDVVDATFTGYRTGEVGASDPTFTEAEHISMLSGVAAEVFLAPPLLKTSANTVGQQWLVQHLADMIKGWIGQRELAALGRKVAAGDIMILFKDRMGMFAPLAHALRNAGVPVTSGEKSAIMHSLATKDVMALLRYLLRRDDCYQLACVLKSAFIGLSEADLMDLALPRGNQSLHQALFARRREPAFTVAVDWLEGLRKQTDFLSISALLGMLYHQPCPRGDSGLQAMKGRLGADAERHLRRLEDLAVEFELDNATGLQGFVDALWYRQSLFKDRVEGEGVVRMMTIHGAKGLQAPIVIMPETMLAEKAPKSPILLHSEGLPMINMGGGTVHDLIAEAKEKLEAADRAEHWRLLYVALTRAAYELHLFTAKSIPNKGKPHWYQQIQLGMQILKAEEIFFEDDETLFDGKIAALRFSSQQTVVVKPDIAQAAYSSEDIPDWLATSVSPAVPRASFLYGAPGDSQQRAAQRGIVLHGVLAGLCGQVELARVEPLLMQKLHSSGLIWDDDAREEMRQTLLRVLTNDEIVDWLGNAEAEVEIGAVRENGRPELRRIDALCVEDARVTILDFKSDREPTAVMPQTYREQLENYAALVQKVYPSRTVQAGIVWLENAKIEWLEKP